MTREERRTRHSAFCFIRVFLHVDTHRDQWLRAHGTARAARGLGAAGRRLRPRERDQGRPETAAHLLMFDSVHGRWNRDVRAEGGALVIDGQRVAFTAHDTPAAIPWGDSGVDIVLRIHGQGEDDRGAARAPRPREREDRHRRGPGQGRRRQRRHGRQPPCGDPVRDRVLTAASCTTNCLAPVVKVITRGSASATVSSRRSTT
jgi:glyceraldehyde-3-phosphate dehydrogenase/erythrose-4-phosphate dehydrogenase